jgi:hypothetical protein
MEIYVDGNFMQSTAHILQTHLDAEWEESRQWVMANTGTKNVTYLGSEFSQPSKEFWDSLQVCNEMSLLW